VLLGVVLIISQVVAAAAAAVVVVGMVLDLQWFRMCGRKLLMC
jgi:uncharacterized membrane protein YccF (DUF307 family)